MYVFLYAPILVVIIYSFNSGRNVAVFQSFSLTWYRAALNDETIRDAIEPSFKIAIANAIVAVVLGTAAALAISRLRPVLRLPFDVLVFLTLVVPELVLAISALIFFVNTGFVLGGMTMFLGHAIFNVSLVMLIVRARFVEHGQHARGSQLRPRRRAALDVPADHAAAPAAGRGRGRPARVRVLVRRRGHLELHVGRGQSDVAAAHPLGAQVRPAARPQRHGHDDVRRHDRRCW